MKLTPGMSAFVTGGASGIGKALCLALAGKGIFVTVVDFAEDKGNEVATLAQKENSKFHSGLGFPSALFLKCDVTNSKELHSAFERHVATYGGLDICINNAGIYTYEPFHKDESDGSSTWRRTLDVNVVALVECTQIAIKIMREAKKPGAIVNMGSAAGLYPTELDPIYQCSKAGVILFTRALAHLKSQGIRINVLCPEFIETDLGSKVGLKVVDLLGGFIPMEILIEGAFELITNEDKAGACMWITNRRGIEYWPTPSEEAKYSLPSLATLHIQPKE